MKNYQQISILNVCALVFIFISLSFSLFATDQDRHFTVLGSLERQTEQGPIRGFKSSHQTISWHGIPYAQAPVGELRWKAPLPPLKRKDILIANNNDSVCLQKGGPLVTFNIFKWNPVIGDEDCLYLNIVAPNNIKKDEQLPVMLWIHGGGNSTGFKGNKAYSGEYLAHQGRVILVNVNYRLGPLGWFLHPALTNNSDDLANKSGNFGTLDLIQALKWTQRNIENFGGKANNITVFGESAGGTNTFSLILSPQAKGLFQQAIIQSGSYAPVTQSFASLPNKDGGHLYSSSEIVNKILVKKQIAKNENEAINLQKTLTPQELAGILRNFSAKRLIELYPDTIAGMLDFPALNKDGFVIPNENAETVFANKENYNNMPIILGSNRDENKTFMAFDSRFVSFPLRIKNKEHYNQTSRYLADMWKVNGVDKFARVLAETQDNVYAYRFDWDEFPKIAWVDFSELIGAGHGLEVPFLFTQQHKKKRKALSDIMIAYWTNFAYTGSPNRSIDPEKNNTLPIWSEWDTSEQADKFILLDAGYGAIRMSNQELFENQIIKPTTEDLER